MKGKLDPQVAELLEAVEEAGLPAFQDLPYNEARRFYLETSRKVAGPEVGGIVSESILLDPVSAKIPARHYRPENAAEKELPLLIYFHGGGWCVGDLDTHDHVCRWLCSLAECAVISVDYRLGPEHQFPSAVEDAITACRWISDEARQLKVDPARIAVGGDSAGGNLSAVVTLLARDDGGPDFCCQLLIYPATDMLLSFPSHASCGDGYRLTRSSIAWFICGYLRSGEDMRDWRASPLLAEDHRSLPGAFILTAEFDPLKDEGEAYAGKLEEAGVAVQYKCYEGMIHGFIAMPGAVDMARTALQDAADYLRGEFAV